ncbi:MAG: gamma-glutamylcyclotransferase, partial [Candidatus Cloacimonetes bacterium]|nr:gamma-glutamylcyclotransferase [Candidatus Cloacimonadota bacterium]
GTLRKGQNNHYLLNKARFVKESRVEGFQMYSRGFFPFLYEGEGSIVAELYEINQNIFISLDLLEGYPHHYQRKIVSDVDGEQAWIYYYENRINERYMSNGSYIESGDWLSFNDMFEE